MEYYILILFYIHFCVNIQCNQIEISSYSKVAKNINDNVGVEQPSVISNNTKIHRAREGVMNPALWFPSV